MTQEQMTLKQIQLAVNMLPPELREACQELSDHILVQVARAGEQVGPLAIGLAGATLAAMDNPFDARNQP